MKNIMYKMMCAGMLMTASVSMAVEAEWLALLSGSGAVEYAENSDYGKGIDAMVLGYDATGKIVAGMAVRDTKTYRKAPMVVLVTENDGVFTITSASTPELKFFAGKSKDYVQEALNDIQGRNYFKADEARELVDAVSGATAQRKAIYVSYGLMVNRIITEMTKGVDWPRRVIR